MECLSGFLRSSIAELTITGRNGILMQKRSATAVGDSGFTLMQNTEEDPLMAAATKYAAAQIESEVNGKCCPRKERPQPTTKRRTVIQLAESGSSLVVLPANFLNGRAL